MKLYTLLLIGFLMTFSSFAVHSTTNKNFPNLVFAEEETQADEEPDCE
ncbi:MAG: hypothetical protein VX864_01590 [Pseudomonadota bacterium]|nr:hypothetical protein [Pseudomonadota bacterium]MED5430069.1 hypothetical protein [Pseudomonadota bacterium]